MNWRKLSGVAVLALTVFLAGCLEVAVISGPSTLALGDTASFLVSVRQYDGGSSPSAVYFIAEIPTGWSLVAHSYITWIDDVPFSGSGTVVPEPFPGCIPGPRDGFQHIWITEDVSSLGSYGEVSLEFSVGAMPPGEFHVRFWSVTSQPEYSCDDARPAVATINRQHHVYEFFRTIAASQGALQLNRDFVFSSNDRQLYDAGVEPPAHLAVFDRNQSTGMLELLQLSDSTFLGPRYYALAISPDDLNLYAVSDYGGWLSVLNRDPLDGTVSFSEIFADGVGGVDGIDWASDVAVSPGGENVYVTGRGDNAVACFSRDPATGNLAFVEAYFEVDNPTAVAVSPDSENVYVAEYYESAVTVFTRDAGTGELTFLESHDPGDDWLSGPMGGLLISPDGEFLYVSGVYSNSILIYSRSPVTGALTLHGAVFDSDDGVLGLIQPRSLAMSSDGTVFAAAGSDSLCLFERDPSTGLLSFLEADFEGDSGITGLYSQPYNPAFGYYPQALAFSGDGLDLLHGVWEPIAVFSQRVLFRDGFESGDTSAWSATVP